MDARRVGPILQDDPVALNDQLARRQKALVSSPKPVRQRGRPPVSEGDNERRRTRIIDAATRMFIGGGYAETTLDAIGRQAGVPKRLIYDLIGDKEELLEQVCIREFEPRREADFNLELDGRSAREVLEEMAQRLMAQALDPVTIALHRALMAASTTRPDFSRRLSTQGKSDVGGAIGSVLEQLVIRGLIPSQDIAKAAQVFFDAIVGARGFRTALGHSPDIPTPEEMTRRIDMILYGYLERSISR